MALKVFLVEDEVIIREGLRDNIPWQQYGFRFVGEAGDGEMALPLIRKERPDVIITDIKMPFMDGLELTHIVKQEFPNTKIIIISGHDDFEYARQAIAEGVEQYLLKPITRSNLQKALAEVKEKIDAEQKQKNYLRKFQNEMHEYEQSFRRNFFERVFEGQTSLQKIYEEAAKHGLNINAPAFNLILMCTQKKQNSANATNMEQECNEELMRFFARYSEQCLVFRWSINVYGIVVKGEIDGIDDRTSMFMDNILEICSKYEDTVDWYAAKGTSVFRFSQLSNCYAEVNHLFSYRYFAMGEHILTEKMVKQNTDTSMDSKLDNIDTSMVNPELVSGFLENAQISEIPEFVNNFVAGMREALSSKLFWDYLLLNIRFTVLSYVDSIIADTSMRPEEPFTIEDVRHLEIGEGNMLMYIKTLLTYAMEIRDRENESQGKKALKSSIVYIKEHFTDENLSLNEVAAANDISPNYFSAMFSQEMGQTFVEYVTDVRMEKAKELLASEDIKMGDIGPLIGIKNPQYFSFVFKKTQGMSPREYKKSLAN